MNEIFPSSDMHSEITVNGYLVRTEMLKGEVKLVTIESMKEPKEPDDMDVPEFLSGYSPGQYGAADNLPAESIETRISDFANSWNDMRLQVRTEELCGLVRRMASEAGVFIRGLCETEADSHGESSDGLIYISKEQLTGMDNAEAVIESVFRQIDEYRIR